MAPIRCRLLPTQSLLSTEGNKAELLTSEVILPQTLEPMSNPSDILMNSFPDATQWTVSRRYHELCKVAIRPNGSVSLARWVADVRRRLPSLRDHSPAELLESVRCSGLIDLGMIAGREAQRIFTLFTDSGAIIDAVDVSYISYFASVDGSGLIIEDDSENQAFCLKLIADGANVEEIQS